MTKTTNNKSSKKWVAGIICLVLVIGVLFGVYKMFGAKTTQGAKSITIEVIDDSKNNTSYSLNTDAEYLRQAMDEADLTYSGEESDYGMMVDTINGIRADYTLDNAYWSFYVNDEYCNYGIDTQPVADGDTFKIEYTPAQ